MTLAEQLDLKVYRHGRTGRWMVDSREMAAATGHTHPNVKKVARRAARELKLSDALVWGRSLSDGPPKRWLKHCYIPRLVVAQMRMHNMPRCRVVPQIMAEYLRVLDMHEAAQPARVPLKLPPKPEAVASLPAVEPGLDLFAEPAPDSEIRPPDPEPADTLTPVPVPLDAAWALSWQIGGAIEFMKTVGAPDDAVKQLRLWHQNVTLGQLAKRPGSWGANAIFADAKPMEHRH